MCGINTKKDSLETLSTVMFCARLLLLVGTSYMGHDWSAGEFIEKHGGEESETYTDLLPVSDGKEMHISGM